MPTTFKHRNYITTESLRWQDADYDATAGVIGLQASEQADSTPHLFFVDIDVETNDGRSIKLERVEGGKLLSILLKAQEDAQRDKPRAAYASVEYQWEEQ